MAILEKYGLMYWVTVIGGILTIFALVVGTFIGYHASFASSGDFEQFRKDYQKFTTQQSITNLRAERRYLQRVISTIEYRAHDRQLTASEAERIREKQQQIKEITEDLKDKK